MERKEGREEATAACSSEGLPPFLSSLRRDGGHMVMLEGRALAGGLLIYLDLGGGAPVQVSSWQPSQSESREEG